MESRGGGPIGDLEGSRAPAFPSKHLGCLVVFVLVGWEGGDVGDPTKRCGIGLESKSASSTSQWKFDRV